MCSLAPDPPGKRPETPPRPGVRDHTGNKEPILPKPFFRLAIALTMLALGGVGAVRAQGTGPDNAAEIRTRAMADAVRTANLFAAAVQSSLAEIAAGGGKGAAYYEVAVTHPDRLAWTAISEDGDSCSGDFAGRVLRFDAGGPAEPVTLEGPVDRVLDGIEGACALPIAGLLRSDLLTTGRGIVLDRIDLASEAGAGAPFHAVGLRRGDIAWQFSVAQAEQPAALGYVATFVRDETTSGYVVTFQSWKGEAPVADPAAVSELSLGR